MKRGIVIYIILLFAENVLANDERADALTVVESPQFGVGVGASDITGIGFLLKQYLAGKREIDYSFFASHEEREIEAEESRNKNQDSKINLGLAYRQELGGKDVASGIFTRIAGGWFVGGQGNFATQLSFPRKQDDFSSGEGAVGGGAYTAVDMGVFRAEGSVGLRYLENRSKKWIDEFSKRGKEVVRNFTVGGGISLTYGF